MTLIISMMQRPLDPGYAAAADEREAAGLPRASSLRSPLPVVTAIIVGLLLGTGAVALRSNDSSASRARADLVKQITARRATSDDRAQTIRVLQGEVAAARATALQGKNDSGLLSELGKLELESGGVAVTGPGLVLTMDDAPSSGSGSADSRTSADDEGRVMARDLQIVTNSLWEAGAEAISVNKQRLTSRSAIRFAGDAILVNFRPLTRPYTIEAIGDPDSMPNEFAAGTGGAYVRSLQDNFGIRATTQPRKSITLASATSLTTRVAKTEGAASDDRSATDQTTTSDRTETTR